MAFRCNYFSFTMNKFCEDMSTVRLYTSKGEPSPGGFYCKYHGEKSTESFLKILGEVWTLECLDVLKGCE